MNPYKVLGVEANATEAEIRAAWRAKARQWHPDRCSSSLGARVSVAINQAAETLIDPAKRKVVNRELALEALRAIQRTATVPAAPGTPEGPMMKLVSLYAPRMDPLSQVGFVLLATILDRELGKTP
jgi:curved DNA-binding protein CbpA